MQALALDQNHRSSEIGFLLGNSKECNRKSSTNSFSSNALSPAKTTSKMGGTKGKFYHRILLSKTNGSSSQSLPNDNEVYSSSALNGGRYDETNDNDDNADLNRQHRNASDVPFQANLNDAYQLSPDSGFPTGCSAILNGSPISKSQIIANGTSQDSTWFNTWPAEKSTAAFNDSPRKSPTKQTMRTSSTHKMTMNEALQSFALAYSPITKQLHLVEPVNSETKNDVGKEVRQQCRQQDQHVDEVDCMKLDDAVVAPVVKKTHRRIEAGSYSSTISSISDVSSLSGSGSGGLLDPDDTASECSDSVAGANADKKKGLSQFFNKNVFSWKPNTSLTSAGNVWKLFQKSAVDDSTSLQGDSPKREAIVASSSALIQLKRPSNLPAKTDAEEQKHREEYEAMVAAARRKDVQTSVAKQKQQKHQLQLEEQQAAATQHFVQSVLPSWESNCNSRKTRNMWWHGLPSSVRGKVWRLAIGNELNLTQQLYDICLARAKQQLATDSPVSPFPYSNEDRDRHVDDDDFQVPDERRSLDAIKLDVARVFPSLCIFQHGGPYSDVLHSLLAAYVCYRPDVGYVQGMAYLAAILILNMDAAQAFVAFANLLNRPLHLAAYTLNERQMHAYYAAYSACLQHSLPRLHAHFERAGLSPDLYLLDWVYTVYARAMPLDVASRVWDVFLRDGDEFLFRTALGILHLHQDTLLTMDFLHGSQFLTRLPEDLSADLLFKSIQVVGTNIGKQTFSQIVERQNI